MLLKSLCLEFSFKLVTFSKSYARKQKWLFFQNTVYNYNKLHYLKQIHKPDKLVAPGACV